MGRRLVFDEPVMRLADDLKDVGRTDLHHRIVEALRDNPLTDDHVADVQDSLVQVVNDSHVAERDRREAARLIAVGDSLFDAIGRRGYAHVTAIRKHIIRATALSAAGSAQSENDFIYRGSWGEVVSFETSPEFESLSPALLWARARAPWVVVRPWWDDGTEYWAGDGPAPVGYRHLPEHDPENERG